jgi:hypothetical protein
MDAPVDIAASVNALHRQTVDDAKKLQRVVLIVGIMGAFFIGVLGFNALVHVADKIMPVIDKGFTQGLQKSGLLDPSSHSLIRALDFASRIIVIFVVPAWMVAQICALYLWLAKRRHTIRTVLPVAPIGPGERALFQVVLGQSLSNANIWIDVEIDKQGQLKYGISKVLLTLAIGALAFVFLFIRTAIWG